MTNLQAPIGVFDSGVGGISTLRTLAQALPKEDFIFYGDSKNAPYGEKAANTVIALSQQVVDELRKQQVKAIVIACNTATSAAKPALIAANPDIPLLGIEPALKEAVDAGKKHILVMATPLTLSRPKYLAQRDRFSQQALIQSLPCPGLADLIEGGAAQLPAIERLLTSLLRPLSDQPIDAVVLGCTHYPFITELIRQKFAPTTAFYTGYEGVANNLKATLAQAQLLRPESHQQQVRFMSSRNTVSELKLYQQLFDHGIEIAHG